MALSENDYVKLCEFNPFFHNLDPEHFEPKIWLIFVALKNGMVSQESVASNPCQSLMKHKITYDQIGMFLNQLNEKGILKQKQDPAEYQVIPKIAYDLHRICYELSLKVKTHTILTNLIHECGYPSNGHTNEQISRFQTGGDNERSEVIKDLLSQIAYSGTEFILKCIIQLNT